MLPVRTLLSMNKHYPINQGHASRRTEGKDSRTDHRFPLAGIRPSNHEILCPGLQNHLFDFTHEFRDEKSTCHIKTFVSLHRSRPSEGIYTGKHGRLPLPLPGSIKGRPFLFLGEFHGPRLRCHAKGLESRNTPEYCLEPSFRIPGCSGK